jgi:EAL domain-containing protein (putative c-di-GMP-specific phosphodiesterase class I)/GGDEF domain-containing protein
MPSAFRGYAAALAAAAAAAIALLVARSPLDVDDGPAVAVFALLIFAGEMLPLTVPRGEGFEEVTVSAPFALAAVALFGPLAGVAMYGAACFAVDLLKRTSRSKAAFNLSQSVIALAAAGGAYSLLGDSLVALLGAAVVFFTVDNVLADVGGALLAGRPTWSYAREDLGFHAWTSGILLVLAPVAVACAGAGLWLVPILFAPVLAVYLGGREAVMNTHQSLHDPLTGLPNRGYLVRRLEAWAGGEVTLVAAGFDELPALVQTLGRERGENLVRAIALRLGALAAHDCFVAALGPDEFAVARRGADPPVVADVRDALERPLEIAGLALDVSPRCGVASSPCDAECGEPLIRAAAAALNSAREESADWAAYVPDRPDPFLDRVVLASQLRRALDRGELVVNYQPKCPLGPGRRVGAEALVRWDHPQLGRLGPQAFVPLAERLGLIEALTRRVLELALRQCAAWRAQGLDVQVAVNLSARCLLDSELPAFIDEQLLRFDVPPDCLLLEITESELVADVVHARRMLERLADRGVGWAIDDFGTGYSSLAQLQRLPVQELKIDRSFVQAMPGSASDDTIVRSTIELGRNLGLCVTAEGVESEAVLLRLAALGCDFAQGYHLGRPVSGEDCGRTLARFARRAALA